MTLEKEILIADSGATKTDWCLTKNGEIIQRFPTKGISPVFQTGEEITQEIRSHVYPELKDAGIKAIYFYGAGCIPEKTELVREAIHQSFPVDTIHVHSDLVAAAHSLCGHSAGIACILGTGSNSCQWDGSFIVKQISPLGFILGDEGSGAVLGKNLVGDALKNQLTDGLKEALLDEYDLTPAIIIDKVYRQPFPNRFLASLSPFLLKHIGDQSIRQIVIRSFSAFFERNVMQYDYQKNIINFVGSIAWYFSAPLKEAAAEKGIEVGIIAQSPMPGLVEYHNY
ncbi:MAG: ATPase [Bacteroidia bacterium 44-10]|jgi:N-acetylglucosamine kinase-like BadF-type ATPase|nr:MAG: ATPase [Bacteroidia bacterium 44-10]